MSQEAPPMLRGLFEKPIMQELMSMLKSVERRGTNHSPKLDKLLSIVTQHFRTHQVFGSAGLQASGSPGGHAGDRAHHLPRERARRSADSRSEPHFWSLLLSLLVTFGRASQGDTRVIVFTTYRESVRDIVQILGQAGNGVKAMEFVGQGTSKAGANKGNGEGDLNGNGEKEKGGKGQTQKEQA
eukprot:1192385-Prorocentrum_minimum.AAC.2